MMFSLILAVSLAFAPSNEGGYLYRTLLVRAAPGQLLELIDLYQSRIPVFDAAGEERPFIIRHSQGDQWDLLLLYPMGSFSDYYAPERIQSRERAARDADLDESDFRRALDARIAWREEVFVAGPELEVVDSAFAEASYFHVEMFLALPGKREALLEERRMENAYLDAIGRPQNLIFRRVAGAAWDSYTVGFYHDIKHFAASADVPEEERDAAAREAGFDGADRIGTYLRTLIDSHHDTLGTAIR
ncbi:MAG: hypothetical protein JSU87_07425 [Gemmatimonadota bacterium]|nr:MAG: hypothetical protein JSU87_07425 [Gemmatimonadota bacterium]